MEREQYISSPIISGNKDQILALLKIYLSKTTLSDAEVFEFMTTASAQRKDFLDKYFVCNVSSSGPVLTQTFTLL